MRTSIRALIILVVFSGHALAKGKKGAGTAKSGAGMMDSNDPVDKETADDGPFGPKHKSEETEAKEKEKAQASEHQEIIKRRPRDKAGVFGNIVIGFGKPTEPGPGSGSDGDLTNKGTSFTFMVGGHYDVSPQFTLGLRVPWTTANVRQLDGSNASSQALGTPELMGEYRVLLSPRTDLPIDFGLGVPVGQGNYQRAEPAYRQTIVNDFADAASGYRDGELFGPKRLPLIFGVGLDYQRKELSLRLATKFVLGVKVGGALDYGSDPQMNFGTYELKSVTFRNVTSAGISYQFLAKPALYGALDSWVATNAINNVEFTSAAGATSPSRVQVIFEPRLGARFGKISPSVGYIFPIGGRLADNHTSGLELHCDVAF